MLSLKRGVVATCMAGAALFVPTAAFATTPSAPPPVQIVGLTHDPALVFCNGPGGGTPANRGDLAIFTNLAGHLSVLVHLDNAVPNDQYYAEMFDQSCNTNGGYPVTTNIGGPLASSDAHGNLNLVLSVNDPGATAGMVWLFDVTAADTGHSPPGDSFQSAMVPLG